MALIYTKLINRRPIGRRFRWDGKHGAGESPRRERPKYRQTAALQPSAGIFKGKMKTVSKPPHISVKR